MRKYTRKAIRADLKAYCPLTKDYTVLELVMWERGEGVDINILSDTATRMLSVTWGELRAIKELAKALKND